MKNAAIPRYRRFDGPALFRQGFRPFFLGAGLWALISLGLWMAVLAGWLSLPAAFPPLDWHAHEMIFGFAGAAIAGFLLTAVPNWTGRMPLQGIPLILLFAAWLAGRIAMAAGAAIGALPATVIDLAFPALLLAALGREIVTGRNWRNLPVLIALGLLFAANLLTHLDALGIAETGGAGQRAGLAVVIGLISLIGGRIVPSFTRNWLAKRGATKMPASFGSLDRLALAMTAAGLAFWAALPEASAAGFLLLAAGVLGWVRLACWRGMRTFAEPLVWSLHLGFAWVPLGLGLLGASVLWPATIPAAAAIHALSAGAIGAMTLAVMTRATLGHTGRALAADRLTGAVYLLVALAALARVAAALGAALGMGGYDPLLWLAASAWTGAFALFTLRYGRYLLEGRAPAPLK